MVRKSSLGPEDGGRPNLAREIASARGTLSVRRAREDWSRRGHPVPHDPQTALRGGAFEQLQVLLLCLVNKKISNDDALRRDHCLRVR